MVPVPEDRKMINPRKKYRLRVPRKFINRVGRIDEMEHICKDEYPCPRLVLLYARLGIHRYNLLQGKNLQLSSVKKYNWSASSFRKGSASSYYITSEAMDSALQAFETKVFEQVFGSCVLSCSIAKPLGETIDESKRSNLGENFCLMTTMPQWPPENPFENSSKRYYVLNKSELQDNDWVRLYLELAVAVTNRSRTYDLSNLKILKVAIDTTPQDVDLEFNRKNVAIVYIRYKDSCKARVGNDVDRVAIVRRAFMEQLGCFSLVGQTLSAESIPKKGKKKQIEQPKKGKKQSAQLSLSLRLKRRLLSSLRWLKAYKYSGRLLSSPRRFKAFKHSGVGLSRRLHKARSTFEYVD